MESGLIADYSVNTKPAHRYTQLDFFPWSFCFLISVHFSSLEMSWGEVKLIKS